MPIKLNDRATEARKNLVLAFQGEDASALEQALAAFQDEVSEDLAQQFAEAMETHDERVLAQRGFHQLTKQEERYFQQVIDALKGPNPKQDLTRIATIGDGTGSTDVKTKMMPETVIDEVLKDIEEQHPLLAKIGMTNASYVTTWLRNKHSRQLATWGAVESTIAKYITSAFEVVQVTQGKLSCFAAVSMDMLNLGPRWMAAYVRTCLAEAMACGMEYGVIKGKGIAGEPIGLNRDIQGDVNQTTGYPTKEPVTVTSFDPASYGAVVAPLTKTDDGKVKRSIADLTLVCNLTDYITKVMPASTVLNAQGTYVNNLFPIPTDVITSEFCDSNEAFLFLPSEYDLLVGANRGIEYSDEYQFLEDNRVFKVVTNAAGIPRWNTTCVALDLSQLEPAYLNVAIRDTVRTAAAPAIDDATLAAASKSSYWGHNVSDLQTGLYVADGKVYGTLKKVTSGQLVTDWGEGYFMALKWTCDSDATSLKVGLMPSVSSGLIECVDDADRDGIFKVTDKDTQKFVIITSDSNSSKTQTYDLSNLVLEE